MSADREIPEASDAEPPDPEAPGDGVPEAAPRRKKKRQKKGRKARGKARSEAKPAAEVPEVDAPQAALEAADPEEQERQLAPKILEPKAPKPAGLSRATLIRWAVGAVLAIGGFGGAFLLMSFRDQVERGPLFGILAVLVGVSGLLVSMDLGGSERSGRRSLTDSPLFALGDEPFAFTPVVTVPLALAILAIGAGFSGYDGLPLTIAVSLLPLILSAVRRPAMMVFVVVGYLYLPFLGVYGLWDPWETHYGEVAREMMARDDWISLWWAQEDWFWSKPILIFWTEALSMGVFGVDFMPDANPSHPEWAIRMPHFLLTLTALLSVYALVSKVWTKRAGLVAAVVLATVPHFFLLAHQAITDMPFVANMTVAMCLFGLAVREDPQREVTRYGLGPVTVSARHLVIFVISCVVLPQVLYLMSRNVEFTGEFPPFGWHFDEFMSGSGHNTGPGLEVAGNHEGRLVQPYLSGPAAQPLAQGLIWLTGYLAILLLLRTEKRAQALQMVGFYVFCGLAFMSKGIPGFALPGLVALFFLIASKRWDLLLEGRLRVALGILVVVVTGLPWYVAMYIRHGPPFTERLLIHDHLNRLTAGVHGDNGSIQYFIEQMGYGLFPWIALAPLALAAWLVPWRSVARAVAGQNEGAAAERGTVEPAERSSSAEPPSDRGDEDPRARLVGLYPKLLFLGVGAAVLGFALFGLFYESGAGWLGFGLGLLGLLLCAIAGLAFLGARDETEPAPADPLPDLVPDPKAAAVARRHTLLLFALWSAAAFTLFSAMTTKFHHYIFPAVVPSAILIGIAFDQLLEPSRGPAWRRYLRTVLAVVSPAPVIVGVAALWGDVRGIVPEDPEPAVDWVFAHAPWSSGISYALIAAGVVLLGVAYALRRLDPPGPTDEAAGGRGATFARGAVTTALLAAPPVLALIGRDMSWVTDARPQGYERLIQLFVYNYDRPWPPELDYRPILTGFAIVATITILLAAFRPLRDIAVRAFLGVALLFTVWTLDVYIVDLSPHWGQRELFQEYYRRRTGPEQPVLAYQMNWKGENFYTGNRVNVFVQLDNRELRNWVAEHQGETVFVVLERGRLGGLRSVMRNAVIEELTDDRLCNKFILIKAELGTAPPAATPAREHRR